MQIKFHKTVVVIRLFKFKIADFYFLASSSKKTVLWENLQTLMHRNLDPT